MDNNTKTAEQREQRSLAVGLACIIAGTAILALIGFLFMRQPDEILEGQAEATSVRISGKLPGRVQELYVKAGDFVHAGDTLVHIHSSLAEARLSQAEASETIARAQNQKVDNGTRPQIIAAATEMLAQATAARQIAEKTYTRMENLYNEGVVSEQKRDEAKAAMEATRAAEGAARSQLDLAQAGAQQQDKTSAAAMVTVAQGSVDEVKSVLDDQYLTAPCDGQIDQIYPEPGELVSLGAPIMSLLRTDKKYVVFNVREEFLQQMEPGKKIEVMIPALDSRKVEAEIYYVRDMGSYATWHATKATGDWDSRTFQIKARTLDTIPELRPGMTVIYTPKK